MMKSPIVKLTSPQTIAKNQPSRPHIADPHQGYTRVANQLLEALLSIKLTARQLSVLLAIIRKTYGFNKSADYITNTQIAGMTGIHHTHVSSTKNQLIKMNVLKTVGREIAINTDLSQWVSQHSESVVKPASQTLANSAKPKKLNQLNTKDTDLKNKDLKDHYLNVNEQQASLLKTAQQTDPTLKTGLDKHPEAFIYSPCGKSWGTFDDWKAAQWMHQKVMAMLPHAKAADLTAWANDIRLMRQQDNLSHKLICQSFQWANQHPFWSTNILSPHKLRKQWNTLQAQQQQLTKMARNHHTPALDWDSTDWAKGIV